MNPLLTATLCSASLALFVWGAAKWWRRLSVARPPAEPRFDRIGLRLIRTAQQVLSQSKLRQEPVAGIAHQLIFLGFLVLLLRTATLVGRGFEPSFNLWLLAHGTPLANAFALLKDLAVGSVLVGASVFVILRLNNHTSRLSRNLEGLLILGAIMIMMIAELAYDGGCLALIRLADTSAAPTPILKPFEQLDPGASCYFTHPAGSVVASFLIGLELNAPAISAVAHAGYWTHLLLVAAFLASLPYTKHFHIVAAPLNLLTAQLDSGSRLPALATSSAKLMTLVENAAESDDPSSVRIGTAKLEHLSWKDGLDLISCTECGRCSSRCPATLTARPLNPKLLTLSLRDAWRSPGQRYPRATNIAQLVGPDVIWACTTCGACEQECPVGISYVDKIVNLRRHLVMMQGEPAPGLTRLFEGLELNQNPWNLSPLDRTKWHRGLSIPTMNERPNAKVLFWVGCAAAFDERIARAARATARLFEQAGVDFAVLGVEERCTGDAARRAGHELLYLQLAEANIRNINAYVQQGGARRIVTLCPHCHNTLANEYPELGGTYCVSHHSDYLLELLREGRLKPRRLLDKTLTFHDPCYLSRHSNDSKIPRALLARISRTNLREVPDAMGNRALCCGGGGAQMWIERASGQPINERRVAQLAQTGADTIATACPFCTTMLRDGLTNMDQDSLAVSDIAELLWSVCSPRSTRSSLPLAGVELKNLTVDPVR